MTQQGCNVTVGCGMILFWVIVLTVVGHFILKYW